MQSRSTVDDEYELEYPLGQRRKQRARQTPLGVTLWILTGVGLFAAVITLLLSRGHRFINIRPVHDDELALEVLPETTKDDWRAPAVNGDPTEHWQGMFCVTG